MPKASGHLRFFAAWFYAPCYQTGCVLLFYFSALSYHKIILKLVLAKLHEVQIQCVDYWRWKTAVRHERWIKIISSKRTAAKKIITACW
jgi:hypothetical protein